MYSAGRLHRGAETAGNAQDKPLQRHQWRHALQSTKTVLDDQDIGLVAHQRRRAAHRAFGIVGLCGDDHQLAGPGLGRVAGGSNFQRAVAADAFDPEALCGDGGGVFSPAVDQPDLMAGFLEQRAIDTAHGAGTEDADFHVAAPASAATIS